MRITALCKRLIAEVVVQFKAIGEDDPEKFSALLSRVA
jgi:hypothetical protein